MRISIPALLARTAGLIAAVAAVAFLPGPALAGGPVPSCSWTSASYVGHLLKDPVKLSKPGPYNGTLDCIFHERHRKLTLKGQGAGTYLLSLHYATFAGFTTPDGAKPVPGLGNCSQGCPGNKPAWLTLTKGLPVGKFKGKKILTQAELDIADGSNSITILCFTPRGTLKVHEVAQLEKLARKVLPRFYDNA